MIYQIPRGIRPKGREGQVRSGPQSPTRRVAVRLFLLFFCFVLVLWVTPGNTWVLLDLHSEIAPSRLEGPHGMPGTNPHSSKCLTAVLSHWSPMGLVLTPRVLHPNYSAFHLQEHTPPNSQGSGSQPSLPKGSPWLNATS